MGKNNADLIRKAEDLKKRYGKEHVAYLEAEKKVNESQRTCSHQKVRYSVAKSPSPTGLIRKGDSYKWCLDCSLPLEVNGTAWTELKQKN